MVAESDMVKHWKKVVEKGGASDAIVAVLVMKDRRFVIVPLVPWIKIARSKFAYHLFKMLTQFSAKVFSPLCPGLPTPRQILGGVWGQSWGGSAGHLGAQGCEIGSHSADQYLDICTKHQLGKKAIVIGRIVQTRDVPMVEMVTRIGGKRIVQMPYGRELPRIC